MKDLWLYAAVFVLIAFSAFFSASEIAFASANKIRLKNLAESGNKKAKLAYFIYENYSDALSMILIGNNLVNMAATSIATLIALSVFGKANQSLSSAVATFVMTVLILVFGEIFPKVVAKENSERFSCAVSIPIRVLMFITRPIVVVTVWIVNQISKLWSGRIKEDQGMTEDELSTIIETVEDEGVIDEERSELLQSAIGFGEITAQEIVKPRVDVFSIDIDDPYDEIVKKLNSSKYSRIPVYEGTIDNIIGILYLKHFYKEAVEADGNPVDLRLILMKPLFIHKAVKLPEILAEMKCKKIQMSIVTDEYGGTLGILTMEDILEQIVGDIWDESDVIINEFSAVDKDTYEVSGDLGIYDFLEYLDLSENRFESEYISVGGWAIEMLDGYPKEGESFDYENITVTVKKMSDLRIVTLMVKVHPVLQEE